MSDLRKITEERKVGRDSSYGETSPVCRKLSLRAFSASYRNNFGTRIPRADARAHAASGR